MLKHLAFPSLILGIAGMAFIATITLGATSSAGFFIQIAAAPSGASILIDGNNAKAGRNQVQWGDHVVTVSKDGFATQTQNVTTNSKEAYVDAVLIPNSPTTKNWYDSHPSDQQLAQGISSQAADRNGAAYVRANPFLNQLPTLYGDGNGGFVNIAPGAALPGSSQPAIYISASTPVFRQDALTYIRSHGGKPADMDLVFSDAPAPLSDHGGGE